MPQFKLTYYNLRNHAEPARLIFQYTGQAFEDVRIPREKWPEMKNISETGKLPFLDVDDERVYESAALTRYLGHIFGLAGKDEMEDAQIDSIVDTYKDFFADARIYHSVKRGRVEGNLEELRQKYDETCKKWYTYLQSHLDKSNTGFIASKLSWADFVLAEGILTMKNFDEEFAEKYPKILEYKNRIHAHPKIKNYIESRENLNY
uniref:Glutathione S-transferase n=1 Tax=Panagrolaimus sp. ES5 TaxID=591445 RepID=A0AC34G0X4_9BILA